MQEHRRLHAHPLRVFPYERGVPESGNPLLFADVQDQLRRARHGDRLVERNRDSYLFAGGVDAVVPGVGEKAN